MRKIVAIGGGELKDLETLPIDRHVVSLTEKPNPLALFIPTASMDAPRYIDTFNKVYGDELKCQTSALTLWETNYSQDDLRDQILSADLIYVGGGNTLKMLTKWRELGVDILLREAYDQGKVLSGLSAGAICWFDHGISDSPQFSDPNSKEFIKIAGLGLVKGTFSPHNIREGAARKSAIEQFASPSEITFVADDNSALELSESTYRVMLSSNESHISRVYSEGNTTKWEPIVATEGNIKTLYELPHTGGIETK